MHALFIVPRAFFSFTKRQASILAQLRKMLAWMKVTERRGEGILLLLADGGCLSSFTGTTSFGFCFWTGAQVPARVIATYWRGLEILQLSAMDVTIKFLLTEYVFYICVYIYIYIWHAQLDSLGHWMLIIHQNLPHTYHHTLNLGVGTLYRACDGSFSARFFAFVNCSRWTSPSDALGMCHRLSGSSRTWDFDRWEPLVDGC